MNYESFALERWMTRWELDVTHDICESGISPLSLNEFCSLIPEAAANELQAAIMAVPLNYSEARGTIDLRTVLAATYESAEPDNILVTTGAIEANYLLFNVLVQPGDHVIAVDPAYQQLQSVPKALGADVSLLSVVQDDGYYYDIDLLRQMVRPNTRLMVINTPHNPTGCILDDAQLDEIVEIARAHDIWILCDEAYRWIEFPGGVTLPKPMRDRYEKGISVGTMSKPFGMPGLRIGWFAGPSSLAQSAWGIRDYVSLSPGKLSDLIATSAITHRDTIIKRNASIIEENLAIARDWFETNNDIVCWNAPRAGLLAMMRYHLDIDSTTLADRLAGEVGVMLAPGDAFGMPGTLRIGIGNKPAVFREGLEKAAGFMRTLT